MTLNLSDIPSNAVNWLRDNPITHRGLHHADSGIFENSSSAAKASMKLELPIELDVQQSSDRVPFVFHDNELERMTGIRGNIRELHSKDIATINIRGTNEKIPSLREFLEQVSGKVGLVVELKGVEGWDEGFAHSVVNCFQDYRGNFALMSFDHALLKDIRAMTSKIPLGLTAEGDDTLFEAHRSIAEALNLDFLSYDTKHIECRFAKEFRKSGRPVICWTVRTPAEAEYCRKYSDQITFEGFRP